MVSARRNKESKLPNQVLHARLSLPDGNTFEDTASIGFTVEAVDGTGVAPATVVTWISSIMNDAVAGQAAPLGTYLSPQLTRVAGGCPVLVYDVTANLSGSPAGSPILTSSISLPAAGGAAALPAQLSAVVAYRSAYGTDHEVGGPEAAATDHRAQAEGAPATHPATAKPRARDRGRLYFGPLGNTALLSLEGGGADSAGQLNTPFYNDLVTAFSAYFDSSSTTPGQFKPVVWSRVGALVKPIAFMAVDAALGVIRKRADTVINRVLTWTPVLAT